MAQSSRNDTLYWLYTACVWHVAYPQMAHAYMRRLLVPQVLHIHMGGLLGVQHLTDHRQRRSDGGHTKSKKATTNEEVVGCGWGGDNNNNDEHREMYVCVNTYIHLPGGMVYYHRRK